MKLSIWRPNYLAHVQKYVKVSTWAIDKPATDVVWTTGYNFEGNSVGYLPPLREVDYYQADDSRNILVSAIQDLYVLARLDKSLAFHQLPIARLEGLHQTFSVITALEWRTIIPPDPLNRGILNWNWLQTNPVAIAPVGDFNSDYIAELVWSARFIAIADPETGVLPAPYTIKRIGGKVYRADIADFDKNILDFNSLLKDDN